MTGRKSRDARVNPPEGGPLTWSRDQVASGRLVGPMAHVPDVSDEDAVKDMIGRAMDTMGTH